MIKEIYQIVENQAKGPIMNDGIRNRIFRANSFQAALNLIREYVNLDKLTITSVNLPGNSLKETQLDLTKYMPTSSVVPPITTVPPPHSQPFTIPVSVSAPIPNYSLQPQSHRESTSVKNFAKPSFTFR